MPYFSFLAQAVDIVGEGCTVIVAGILIEHDIRSHALIHIVENSVEQSTQPQTAGDAPERTVGSDQRLYSARASCSLPAEERYIVRGFKRSRHQVSARKTDGRY